MIVIKYSRLELENKFEKFIWDFKLKDNVFYNLGLVFDLIKDCNDGKEYFKPLSILAVSVIEAILIDFLHRLDGGTKHFPELFLDKRGEIKARLEKEKRTAYSVYEGKEFQYKKIKNFTFSDVIEFFEEYKLLGSLKKDYEFLKNTNRFRNRVHIRNYFDNFEKDESDVFSEGRTQKVVNAMVILINYFEINYKRPW